MDRKKVDSDLHKILDKEGINIDMDNRVLGDPMLARQDDVDNACFGIVLELAPPGSNIDWNIEWITEIREAVQKVVVERLRLMTEEEFYP